MERRFFRLAIDADVPGRWYLSEPTDLAGTELEDPWQFSEGRPVTVSDRMRIPLYRPGRPLDFTTAGVGLAPILSARMAAVLGELAAHDIQLFPVEVQGHREPYHLLNVARTVRCIDDNACAEVQREVTEDGRPDPQGEYRAIVGLRIDTSKVGDARIFRLWGWHPPIIVEGEIKAALEGAGILGARFDSV